MHRYNYLLFCLLNLPFIVSLQVAFPLCRCICSIKILFSLCFIKGTCLMLLIFEVFIIIVKQFMSYKLNSPVQIEVYLNVYDLNPSSNSALYACGLGFYHTGIQLDLKQWTFGGHAGDSTGVMEVPPKTNHPNFRESILLGKTSYSYREIYNMIDGIKDKFPGNSYHLIRKNCNTFTNCFSQALLHKPIPSWVDRMAKIGRFFTETSDFFSMTPYESRWQIAAGELGVKLQQKKDVFAAKGVMIG